MAAILAQRCLLATRPFARHSSSRAPFLQSDDDRKLARWLQSFNRHTIDLSSLQATYARSSGPGGQNVNRVASKVHVRFNIHAASWIPDIVRARIIMHLNHRLSKSGDYVVVSEETRSQKQNFDICLDKIVNDISSLSKTIVRNTSHEQQSHVEKLERVHKERILADKKRRSSKKSQRKRPAHDE